MDRCYRYIVEFCSLSPWSQPLTACFRNYSKVAANSRSRRAMHTSYQLNSKIEKRRCSQLEQCRIGCDSTSRVDGWRVIPHSGAKLFLVASRHPIIKLYEIELKNTKQIKVINILSNNLTSAYQPFIVLGGFAVELQL